MAEIKSEIKKISEFFSNSKEYNIPIYQRNYTWAKKEIDTLMNDLIQFINAENKTQYLMGNIIIRDFSEDSNNHKYDLIDGQQRVTTFLLIYKAIFNLLERYEISQEDIEKYKNNDDNAEEVKKRLLFSIQKKLFVSENDDQIGKEVLLRINNLSNQEILDNILKSEKVVNRNSKYNENYLSIVDRLKRELSCLEDYSIWYNTISNKLIFSQIYLTREDDVHMAFENINSKGKPLEISDLLKNYLLFYSLKLFDKRNNELEKEKNSSKSKINTYNENYYNEEKLNCKKYYDELNNKILKYFDGIDNEGKVSNQKTSLKYIREFKVNDKQKKTKKFVESFLFELISFLTMKKPLRNDNDIFDQFKQYLDIYNPSIEKIDKFIMYLDDGIKLFVDLLELEKNVFRENSIQNDFIFMKYSILHQLKGNYFSLLLLNSEKNSIKGSEVTEKEENDDYKKIIMSLSEWYYKRKITKMKDNDISKKPISVISYFMKHNPSMKFNSHNFIQHLANATSDNKNDGIPTSDDVRLNLKKEFNKSTSKEVIQYVLYIANHSYDTKGRVFSKFNDKQIEHIIPQSITKLSDNEIKKSCWKLNDDNLTSSDYREKAIELVYSLGNLTLTQDNQKLSNKCFSKKQEIYFQSHYKIESELSDTDKYLNDFTEEDVKKRGIEIANKFTKFFDKL